MLPLCAQRGGLSLAASGFSFWSHDIGGHWDGRKDVELAVLGVDALDQAADLRGVEVVDRDGDPLAAGCGHELGGLLDRLRTVVFGAPLPGGAAGAVHGRPGLAERNRRAATGAARRPGHQRNLAVKRCHDVSFPNRG